MPLLEASLIWVVLVTRVLVSERRPCSSQNVKRFLINWTRWLGCLGVVLAAVDFCSNNVNPYPALVLWVPVCKRFALHHAMNIAFSSELVCFLASLGS